MLLTIYLVAAVFSAWAVIVTKDEPSNFIGWVVNLILFSMCVGFRFGRKRG